ncbi:hypothetical protein ENSA5_25520 [Enhygromyxa salina]|uniref:Secreted protein n=1 Tax=Enhygromyxa salina TaxID=215803 RepID=A0A2S9YAS7_9BACT|nr:DUF4360 domain-containing protein [Enhygromyxa salina]PRQ02217.1 hypothetical protein ENSA5_25520 [Enhygromyxa salina]
MDTPTQIKPKLHARKSMLFSLGCLAALVMLAPACTDEFEDLSDLDERAAFEDELLESSVESEVLEFDDARFEELEQDGPLHIPNAINEPDYNDVYIEGIVANGAGCPVGNPGTVTTQISPDKKSFIVIFRDMLLENPPGPPVKTLNCLASIKLHVPGGWQVSVATVNTRGYAFLEQGLKARQTSSYFFAGDPVGFSAHTQLKGPYDDLYVFSDKVPFQSLVWSKCGGSAIFAINTTLNLNAIANKTGYGIFNSTDIDGQFRKVFQWQWKKC